MAKLAQREKAQKLALQGNIDAALTELVSLEAKGNLAANVSLVEIAAYKGSWQEVMERVALLFGTPDSMITQNVYEDMALLLARAGGELRQWAEVRRIAKFAKTKLSRYENDDMRFDTIRQLTRFADRNGKGSFFPEGDPEDQQKAQFGAALEKSQARKFATPLERVSYLYALARVTGYYPAAVDIYDREKTLPNTFDKAVFTASALARDGREQDAWSVIRSSLKLWGPVDVVQVLPVVLLVNDAIKPLMTPKRCAEVLRTPRGPLAGQE